MRSDGTPAPAPVGSAAISSGVGTAVRVKSPRTNASRSTMSGSESTSSAITYERRMTVWAPPAVATRSAWMADELPPLQDRTPVTVAPRASAAQANTRGDGRARRARLHRSSPNPCGVPSPVRPMSPALVIEGPRL